MKDQHSAAANMRSMRREYYDEMVRASNEKREPVMPRFELDPISRAAVERARARRAARAAKHAGGLNVTK